MYIGRIIMKTLSLSLSLEFSFHALLRNVVYSGVFFVVSLNDTKAVSV